ncbi:MAG: hypothetical protein M5U12_12640 [Verrucomicrobia bacterium]|nr:hypothetical protein [Verrucomicrobiota bacterium]
MSPEHKSFLTLAFTPARLDAEQAAWYLGFQPHDIPVLIAAGLLRPLGRPQHNAVKYFATVELSALRDDPKWLAKATDAVQSRWRRKNRTEPAPPDLPQRSRPNGHAVDSVPAPTTTLT